MLNETDRELLADYSGEGAVIINKTDLPQIVTEETVRSVNPSVRCLTLSTKDQNSLKALKEFIESYISGSDQLALTQPRHLDAARRALRHLKDAMKTLESFTPDVAATDLQAAQAAISEITGDNADEKLLDHVFSGFCVGK